jgi:hypothetical protein
VNETSSRQGVRNVQERACNTGKQCFQPCQGWGRGFKSHRPLQIPPNNFNEIVNNLTTSGGCAGSFRVRYLFRRRSCGPG